MMTRSARQDHSALLLEGIDDERFYRNVLHPKCLSFPLDGRTHVLGTLAVLSQRKQNGVAAIIDADCDYLDASACPRNVFRTDFRDVECFLIQTGALAKVLHEHLIREPIATFRERLLRSCADLGVLRWHAAGQGLAVDFGSLDYERFIDPVSLTPNRARLGQEILRTNPNLALSEQDLVDAIIQAENPKHNLLHLCAGHDLTAVLAMWISKKWGVEVSPRDVERQLRLAVSNLVVLATKMAREIRTWEQDNAPFRILVEVAPPAASKPVGSPL